MWAPGTDIPPPATHDAVAAHLQHAAESYFYIGQVIAMPALADAPKRVRQTPPQQGGPKG